jgi:DNA-binding GntR family transcriptional regulator
MAGHETHARDCLEQLGEEFGEVHEWLDEYFDSMGTQHRSVRHHKEGIEEARKKWGDRAAMAAEIHIRRDFDGRIPDRDELEFKNKFLIDWRSGIGMV